MRESRIQPAFAFSARGSIVGWDGTSWVDVSIIDAHDHLQFLNALVIGGTGSPWERQCTAQSAIELTEAIAQRTARALRAGERASQQQGGQDHGSDR